MANMTISLDAPTKKRFSEFCDNVGLSASSVINVYIKTVVRENRIPFTIAAYTSPRDDIADLESDIEISRREFAAGKSVPNDVVFDRLHKKLLAMKKERVAV